MPVRDMLADRKTTGNLLRREIGVAGSLLRNGYGLLLRASETRNTFALMALQPFRTVRGQPPTAIASRIGGWR